MKTNTKPVEDEEDSASGSSESVAEVFKAGDFVRSTFTEDGVDYEAEVLSVNENGTCLIRFIGYGNEERVKMENLVASWGFEAREEQKILAEADQQDTSEMDNHQEQLHQFVVNKSQDFRGSLPIPPPMVSPLRFLYLRLNAFSLTKPCPNCSRQCHQLFLTTIKTRNTCRRCSCPGIWVAITPVYTTGGSRSSNDNHQQWSRQARRKKLEKVASKAFDLPMNFEILVSYV